MPAEPVVTASLKTFLRTGKLGPVSADMTAADIGRCVGPPSHFVVGDNDLFPGYWTYNHLEISFKSQRTDKPPYGMNFFQLEFAYRFAGDFVWAAENRLSIDLDGLSGTSPLSVYAAALVDIPDAVIEARRFNKSSDWNVFLQNAGISVVFATSNRKVPATPEAMAALDTHAAARFIDQDVRIDSIYAYPTAVWSALKPPRGKTEDDWRRWTVPAYLEAVKQP